MKTAVYTRANRAPRATLSRRALHAHSLESLESRQLFATYNLSDYLPLSTTASWSYAGTASGASANATLSYAAVAGGKIAESFNVVTTGNGTLPGLFTRTFSQTGGALTVVQSSKQLGGASGDTYLDDFGAGYVWLPSTFSDGSTPYSNQADALTRTQNSSQVFSGSGTASGSITVTGAQNISTNAGNFTAVKVTETATSTRSKPSGSPETFTGTYTMTVWLVKGLGIAKVSYSSTETDSQNGNPGVEIAMPSFDLSLTSTTQVDINANVGLKGNGNTITNGSAAPVRTNNTAFGVLDVNGATLDKTFTITNTGTQALHLGNDSGLAVTIVGANAGDFTLLAQPQLSGPTLAPGASTTFTIRFNPSGAGLRNALVTVNTRSLTNSPYTFDIRGTGQYFGILGIQGGVTPATITSGATTASFANGTRFGSVIGDGAHGFARRFIVNNSGTGLINFTGTPKLVLSGVGAGDFVVTVDPSSTLGAGGQTIFRIRFLPQSAGFKKAFVSIANDSSNASPFTFAITGTGV